jgi:hypothetical protein
MVKSPLLVVYTSIDPKVIESLHLDHPAVRQGRAGDCSTDKPRITS